MKAWEHAAIGAAVAVAPDVALALFGWRRRCLGADHPLVRAHKALHSPLAVLGVIGAAYASHVLLDRLSAHRLPRWVECNRESANDG